MKKDLDITKYNLNELNYIEGATIKIDKEPRE
jgi:hypothetical protein